ncbi:septation protein IspZ [Bdellovibrionota bacterium FG-1]
MKSQAMRSLLVAGLLPVIAFTLIEEYYGTLAGLVAGMVFGVGEILYEWRTQGRVDAMTWGGNGLLLTLGAVSLLTDQGVWFKLQPSIMEAFMALVLAGSVILGKPLLTGMIEKQFKAQGREIQGLAPQFRQGLTGMTWRMAVFLALHAALAGWAALRWSTAAWAALKGLGFTLSFVLYLVVESLVLRYRLASGKRENHYE